MQTKHVNDEMTVHEFKNGTVTQRFQTDYNQKRLERLEIQVIDAYGYQRELNIAHTGRIVLHTTEYKYTVTAYRHPGVRKEYEVNAVQFRGLIDHILEMVTKYPSLLFNEPGENRYAQCYGFVHFHDRLLDGEAPTVKMLREC